MNFSKIIFLGSLVITPEMQFKGKKSVTPREYIESKKKTSLTPRQYVESLGTIESHIEKMNDLIKNHVSKFPPSSHKTISHAFQYNNFRGIIHLLSHSPSPHEQDEDGSTLLHHACQFLHEKDNTSQLIFKKEAIKILLLLGFDSNIQNNKGNTPLHCAIETMSEYYYKDIIVILLHAGANSNTLNAENFSPLYLLLRDKAHCFDATHMMLLIELFLQKGADPFSLAQDSQHSPYKFAMLLKQDLDETVDPSSSFQAIEDKKNAKEIYEWFINRCEEMQKERTK